MMHESDQYSTYNIPQVYIAKIIKSSGLGKLAYKPDW